VNLGQFPDRSQGKELSLANTWMAWKSWEMIRNESRALVQQIDSV
jgi:hypothetical protein